MRSKDSYRAGKKRKAKEAGLPFSDFNRIYNTQRGRARDEIIAAGVQAGLIDANEAIRLTPEQARRKLAEWAAMKGRTKAEVDAANAKAQAVTQPSPAFADALKAAGVEP